MKTVDAESAKKSWESAGLTEQGRNAIAGMIDQVAEIINANPSKYGAYADNVNYHGNDPKGRVGILAMTAEQLKNQ